METLKELIEAIEEKKYEKQKLWIEINEKEMAVKEVRDKWEAIVNEISELESKKWFLNQAELSEEEKAEVDKKLQHLELILNQPDVLEIKMSVSDADHESRNLQICLETFIEKEGLKYDVTIWSNRTTVINLVKSYIQVLPFSRETYYQNRDYYQWKKADTPGFQLFKRSV